jgi:uncharacterized protein YukE
MDTLSSQGLNEYETKIIVGKAIPLSDLTYLQTLKRSAFQKYQKAYPGFSLRGTETNHRLEEVKEAMSQQEQDIRSLRTRLDIVNDQVRKLEELNADLKHQQERSDIYLMLTHKMLEQLERKVHPSGQAEENEELKSAREQARKIFKEITSEAKKLL